MFENFMRKFVHWLDPKLDKYRTPKSPAKPPKYTPKSLADFVDLIRRTPKSVLSNTDRSRIAAVMSFDDKKVHNLMATKRQMVFVHHQEILGPLVLDKLYKSGFTEFPVIDDLGRVKGIIHTEALNALEVKKTNRADKYLDKDFHYLHANDSLSFAIEESNRLGTSYFLVLDDTESLTGFFTIQMLLDYLLH